jgi:hypothetical protein
MLASFCSGFYVKSVAVVGSCSILFWFKPETRSSKKTISSTPQPEEADRIMNSAPSQRSPAAAIVSYGELHRTVIALRAERAELAHCITVLMRFQSTVTEASIVLAARVARLNRELGPLFGVEGDNEFVSPPINGAVTSNLASDAIATLNWVSLHVDMIATQLARQAVSLHNNTVTAIDLGEPVESLSYDDLCAEIYNVALTQSVAREALRSVLQSSSTIDEASVQIPDE